MIPKLPSVRELARELRDVHRLDEHPLTGGCYVYLGEHAGTGQYSTVYTLVDVRGAEHIPSDRAPFDAHAAARRLLSDARVAMKGMR